MRRFAYSLDPWHQRWQYSDIWWSISRFFDRIRNLPNEIHLGLRNVIRYLPIIWRDRDWDWCYLAILMEAKLKHISASTSDWHVMGAPRTARQTRICAHLLQRIVEDDYLRDSEKRLCGSAAYLAAAQQRKDDLEYFAKILSRHMLGWWD